MKKNGKWNLVKSEGIEVIQGHNSNARPEVDAEQRGIEEVITNMKIQFQIHFRRCRLWG